MGWMDGGNYEQILIKCAKFYLSTDVLKRSHDDHMTDDKNETTHVWNNDRGREGGVGGNQSHPLSLIMWASSMIYLPSLYFWLDSKARSYIML
jgi:hypothetical protein